MGRKDEVVPAGLPGFSIGLMSATRHGDGTSPDRQDRFAVSSRQFLPFGERCFSMVLETSSGPAADLAGSRNRALSSSPLVKSLQGLSLSLAAVQEHGDDKALRASRLISASATLSRSLSSHPVGGEYSPRETNVLPPEGGPSTPPPQGGVPVLREDKVCIDASLY